MPTQPTYPGVYIEEVPSDVKTIVGVATARTAFIGRAARGPVDHPTTIKNFGDFERRFGGLRRDCPMTYAVRQYFQNGGSDAIIVRVVNDEKEGTVEGAVAAAGILPTIADEVPFVAKVAGGAGNSVRLDVLPTSNQVFATDQSRFDLHVSGLDANGKEQTEVYENLHLEALKTELDNGSALVTVKDAVTNAQKAAGLQPSSYMLRGGEDAVRARLPLLDAGDKVAVILEATDAGDAGNTITLKVKPKQSPPNTFDITAKKGAQAGVTITGATFKTLKDEMGKPANAAFAALVRVALNTPSPPDAAAKEVDPAAPLAGGKDAKMAGATLYSHSGVDDKDHGADPPGTAFTIEAADPGKWGNNLRISVTHDVAGNLKPEVRDRSFNLVVKEVEEGDEKRVVRMEVHPNLSVGADDARRMDKVLEEESDLVRLRGDKLPADRPLPMTGKPLSQGEDGPAVTDKHLAGQPGDKSGIYALEKEDLFNILCIAPPSPGVDVDPETWSEAGKYCKDRRAMLLVDPPADLKSMEKAKAGVMSGDLSKLRGDNVVFNFPRFEMADPLMDNKLFAFAPCGVVAGLYARTDAERGVWKAPAGQEAVLRGVQRLTVHLTDAEHGELNPLGLNCARTFPVTGTVMWGARTANGADQLASQWKYVPVRRTALYIEESLYRGTQWVVFEPNDEDLWAQIRLNVGAFMHDLFRKGAFQGTSAKDAYFVKCDAETTPQSDIDKGIVNVLVGFAPLKPAEFVIIKLSQITKKGGD